MAVEDILAVLKPMKTASLFISSEKQPTASRILPTLAKVKFEMRVKDTDSNLVINMKNKITENLNTRYIDQSGRSFLLKASFLDPRHKGLHNIATEGVKFVTKQAVRDMCVKMADSESQSANTDFSCSSTLPSLHFWYI